MRALLVVVLATACSGSIAREAPPAAPVVTRDLPDEPIEGMTVSCQTWGWEWGADEMVETMKDLRSMGVEWIAIHPYARIGEDGSVGFKPFPPDAPPNHIARPIREAHALGLKIMIKPHLAYWRSRFAWRGAIAFDDPEDVARFFGDYRVWIEAMAVASQGADLFVVGTELDGLTEHEAQWRSIIDLVRARYSGPLTFASNWDSYERVRFWDALDLVGIQAYFPLVKPGEVADDAALRAGWTSVMRRLAAWSREVERPIVFTELGYNLSAQAATKPWAYVRGGPEAEAMQTRCLAAALDAVRREPTVRGAFIWKWFSGRTLGEDFLASTPAMRAVVETAWGPNSPRSAYSPAP
jgi:hypothetical protein